VRCGTGRCLSVADYVRGPAATRGATAAAACQCCRANVAYAVDELFVKGQAPWEIWKRSADSAALDRVRPGTTGAHAARSES
jgi:hypothetical protein